VETLGVELGRGRPGEKKFSIPDGTTWGVAQAEFGLA
jgi:hypothetical protein